MVLVTDRVEAAVVFNPSPAEVTFTLPEAKELEVVLVVVVRLADVVELDDV